MLLVPQFQTLRSQTRWTAILISLVILGGCSRGQGDRQAQRPDTSSSAHRAADEAEPTSATMPQETVPQETVPEIEATAAEPEILEPIADGALSGSPAAPEHSSKAMSTRAFKTMARESMPAVAATKGEPEFQITAIESNSVSVAENAPKRSEHLSQLPAGAERNEEGFATVQVFYATDRQRGALPLSAYQLTGQKRAFIGLGGCSLLLIAFSAFSSIRGRTRLGTVSAAMGGISGCLAAAIVIGGQASIEKHGVTYTGDRGLLTRGVCEVTVPDTHRRGLVERPSLLRFEIRENQQKHIVLTSAVELDVSDFQARLANTVSNSRDRDLLVFIHGYNVDFESAVQRTAQIAVDLPFEGVPICYSWPSQGSLLGYSIDENNSEWTVAHLEQFLLELAQESGADSINVVAHSMGNRAMTAAMQNISRQVDSKAAAPFDRIVLAAPDIDADRFRRDLAPALLKVANHVTLYASSDDQALIASKGVHGYPRAGESGENIVVVSGIETIDVSGIDLSLLGHSYYGDNESMLRDLYEVVRARLPAGERELLITQHAGPLVYWKLAQQQDSSMQPSLR